MTNLLDVEDIQAIFKVSKTVAYKMVNTPGFPSIKIGGTIRVPEDELEKWVNSYIGKKFELSV